jgi:[ribosomal protein S5]-alanine N-acetyltransferase
MSDRNMVLETKRLILREMDLHDLDDLLEVFSDPEAMQFYPKPFDRQMTQKWIERNIQRYDRDGFGLWALILKQTGKPIGDCGLVVQEVDGVEEIEIGYHLRRDLCGKGLATEAAQACRDYGFSQLGFNKLISLINPDNIASRRVAEKNEMRLVKEIAWRNNPTCVYAIERNNSFLDRVRSVRKVRECHDLKIIDYLPEFHEDFKRLNCEWIEKYFKLEETDLQSLNCPQEKIIKPSGHIYMALRNREIIGTCALIKKDSDIYELAKMAVTEKAQGKGVGWLLGQAAIQKARELGAKTIFLESNTILEPAIELYQKLGFQRIVGQPSPYERCNIQMELKLV